MNYAITTGVLLVFLLTGVASADPPDCARSLRQINHYEEMVLRAEQVGKDDWADKTQNHVDLLEDRLAARCPSYTDRDERQPFDCDVGEEEGVACRLEEDVSRHDATEGQACERLKPALVQPRFVPFTLFEIAVQFTTPSGPSCGSYCRA